MLAAFGINQLGVGDSKKLLKHYGFGDLKTVTDTQLREIRGFGELTSTGIIAGLAERWPEIEALVGRFNIRVTPKPSEQVITESVFTGKHLVFTGKMASSRDEMKAKAESLGAINQSGVNKKTDYLVAGANVGASKLTKAESRGVSVITESQFYEMLGQ